MDIADALGDDPPAKRPGCISLRRLFKARRQPVLTESHAGHPEPVFPGRPCTDRHEERPPPQGTKPRSVIFGDRRGDTDLVSGLVRCPAATEEMRQRQVPAAQKRAPSVPERQDGRACGS